MISLMPGPVEIDAKVQALSDHLRYPIAVDEFIRRFEGVRATLARMTGREARGAC